MCMIHKPHQSSRPSGAGDAVPAPQAGADSKPEVRPLCRWRQRHPWVSSDRSGPSVSRTMTETGSGRPRPACLACTPPDSHVHRAEVSQSKPCDVLGLRPRLRWTVWQPGIGAARGWQAAGSVPSCLPCTPSAGPVRVQLCRASPWTRQPGGLPSEAQTLLRV